METLQEKSLEFNSNMIVSNDGGQLSNDAGLLLLFEFLHKINFDNLLTEHFHIKDSRAYCIHEYKDILKQLIVQLIAGYPQDSAANRLRLDPILKQGLGKEQLASQSMISRFINELTVENVTQFQQLAKVLADQWLHHTNTQHMIIDIDSTHSDTFGNQEHTDFNTHYGTNGYHPLVAFDGLTGLFLDAQLRPGNVYTSNAAESFLASIIQQHKKHSCDMFLTVRGDSGFAKPEIYSLCEEERVKYLIRLKVNKKLKVLAHRHVLYGETTDFTKAEHQYFTIDYQAGSWTSSRKVDVKATREAGNLLFTKYEFIVTNFHGLSANVVFKLYQKRGTMENCIKEIKNGFAFDKTDSSTFVANQARMMISCMAYNLVHLMKEATFPKEVKRSTISTIRFQLFHIAGRLTRHARQLRVHLATSHVFDSLFWEVLENIQSLVLLH